MNAEITKLEYIEVRADRQYAGHKIRAEYSLETLTEGIINRYTVILELRGLVTAEPFFDLYEYEPHTNNEHTLTQDAVSDLIYDYNL